MFMEIKVWDNEAVYEAHVVFENEFDRDEFVAQFPKWVNVYPNILWNNNDPKPIAVFRAVLSANRVVGEVNEAGLKRVAKFKDVVAKLQNEKG
jgi:hypothetical protein